MFNMSLEVISLIEEYNGMVDGRYQSRLYLADNIISKLTIAIKEEEEYYERMAREYEERQWGKAEIESAVIEKELQSFCPVQTIKYQGE